MQIQEVEPGLWVSEDGRVFKETHAVKPKQVRALLRDARVKKINALLAEGRSQRDAASVLGVTEGRISQILSEYRRETAAS